MKILHYSLGLPPFRSGGLTKYSLDLMKQQAKDNDVYLLYPGYFDKKQTRIIKDKPKFNIKIFQLVNPQPVSLMKGVYEPEKFMIEKPESFEVFYEFLKENAFDVIHVHTLMGLPMSFMDVAKKLGAKTVFTSHDFYPICSTVSLYDCNNQVCKDFEDGKKCCECNKNAPSVNKLAFMQSYIYRFIKKNKLVKWLYSKKKTKDFSDNKAVSYEKCYDYVNLRKYYLTMLEKMSMIHFNSKKSMEIYKEYVNPLPPFKIITISHSDIKDNRKKRTFEEGPLRILYAGQVAPFKGFDLLIDALKKLNKINQNWKLIVWGNKEYYDAGEINDKVVLNGEYNLGMLSEIFDSADVAVIPSKRIETFGFVLAEAVSYAMPCIVSSKLGAIDILKNGHNAIICDLYEDDLVDNLLKIIDDRTVLKKINENILNDEFEDFTQHCGKIFNLYTLILGEN